MMGHSPRSNNKLLPVYYGSGNQRINRITRTRSLSNSPGHSPRKGGVYSHNSGMRLLRWLVMLGMGLMLMSLAYIQFAAAGDPSRQSSRAAGAAMHSEEARQAEAAAAEARAPDIPLLDGTTATAPTTAQPAQPAGAPAGGFPAPELTHLILVAGHAVYTGLDFAVANKESSWFLEPYQQIPGSAQSFLDHIRLGIETAAADPSALLLFSGGQTRKAAGPRSEGLSYWLVAEAAGWWGHADSVRGRAYTEEHARDSFENMLFSLCRFFEITGHYPSKITAVSYTLKQKRFEQVHRAAVRFPADAFNFLGTPVPPDAKGAPAGEAATVAAFLRDPYGCSGTLLAKKSRRDPFAVGAPHPTRCPAMAGLLQYCGAKVYTGPVPWDAHTGTAAAKAAAGLHGLLPTKGRKSSRSGIYT